MNATLCPLDKIGHVYAWNTPKGLWAGALSSIQDGTACLYDGIGYHYTPIATLRDADSVTLDEWIVG